MSSFTAELTKKKSKFDAQTAASAPPSKRLKKANPYLSTPVQPERNLQIFLTQVRNTARNYLPKESRTLPITTPFCEVEVRLGTLQVPHSSPARRVTSSGAKHVQGSLIKAFDCTQQHPRCFMDSGVSRSHFLKWTAAGISELGPLALALGVSDSQQIKQLITETEITETVYGGYENERRVVFPGEHPSSSAPGKLESKEKLLTMDLTLPAAPYDMRVNLSSEKVLDGNLTTPPPTWTVKRVKRRRSYARRDKSIAWQIDVTEVTSTHRGVGTSSYSSSQVDYEVEFELRPSVVLQIINEENPKALQKVTAQLASQLWWIMTQINPLADALDVEESLRLHPNKAAVQLALAQCGAFRHFVDKGYQKYESPIANKDGPPRVNWTNTNFVGCMPVNFSRHNLEEIQRSPDNAYFLSEKTDGVRHFLVFTGDTAVLVDRAMRGKQPIPVAADSDKDPFAPILDLIEPGTVFDGEVVMNRNERKPRPIFIVFDVLAISSTKPVLHEPFEQRLRHLRKATFRTKTAARDMFDEALVVDPNVALPLVRKNFVKRTDLVELLSHVSEERGMRCYRNGHVHNHLTDGIIFQPNAPYVLGTDRALLKWKYLDTVTIDVEMLESLVSDDDEALRLGCLGEEQTRVDMTRHVLLPKSERMRLEADRFESEGKICEVGFNPEIGEWYYVTMRSDKVIPNHISTVLGTLLELAESLTTEELSYRMSLPAGTRDTYRKDMRGMMKQLLEHQRRKLQASRTNSGH